MSELTHATLHERADAAAQASDFVGALGASLEALRLDAQDHRARLKVGLCLAMLGRPVSAALALKVVADTLARRGFFLSAIGACRDALTIAPAAPPVMETLERLHAAIHGVDVRGRARVPPPLVPRDVRSDDPLSYLAVADAATLLAAAESVATHDPDGVGAAATPERQGVPFFSELSREAFLSLVPRMGYHKVPAGQVVMREGEDGRSLFILLQGEARVVRALDGGEQELARLGPGTMFGELSLITAKPRSATVITQQPSELFEIDRRLVEALAESHPAITGDIVRFARRRLVENLIATSKIFRPFAPAERLELLRHFVTEVVPKGTRVIAEGAEPRGLFLVMEGEVTVSKVDPAGDEVLLAQLGEGDVFGEGALLRGDRTSASVTASEKTVLLLLERARFEAVAASHPRVREYLAALSEERAQETAEAMSAEGLSLDASDLILV
jgi:CRP-like cAMP-binding protein